MPKSSTFNKAMDIKLIKLVEANPRLYNTADKKYLDFDAREVAWQKIGDTLCKPASACKSRWVNMRDMLRRKVRERSRNPLHRSYKYKYEDELAFMFPFFRESVAGGEEYADFEDDVTSAQADVAETYDEEEIDYDRLGKETKPNLSVLRNKRTHDDATDFGDAAQTANPTDPIDGFMVTIGATLKKFSPYYLNQAKSKIFQVVQDYELEQIMNKDKEKSSDTNT